MNLYNFESYIEKKILVRGYDYYENGNVTSVKETNLNIYEAEVEGTDFYNVVIELDDQANIINTLCDCPYDMGEYCKHLVAVFLALRDLKKNIAGGNSYMHNNSVHLEATLKSSVPKEGRVADIKKILSDRTKDELVEFLWELASEYEEIKQRIELNFDNGNDADEITKSIALIRTYIRNNSDKHGFVGYRDIFDAVKGAAMVLEKARCAFEKNKTMHAVELVLCVMQEMVDFLQGADDSDGIIDGMIEESLFFIDEVIDDGELSPIHTESLFVKLIEEATNKRYEGWTDWRLDLLRRCAELADTPNLRNKLENLLLSMVESEKGDSWSVNYFAERVNLIKYQMVEEYDGQKKALQFIEQNLQYSTFRKMAIENAMKKKDYDLVIKLTLEGEKNDKSWPGLVNDWKKYQYKAFSLSGKLDEQRGLALDFILDGSFEYYKELKSTYDAGEWLSVYPKIIFLFENQKKTYENVYTRILIEEEEKQKLLEYLKGRPSSVENFYKYLIPEFKEEVYALFVQYIEQTAARASNRRDYREVCAIIRNLKKAGGEEQALEIKQKLFSKYTNRPAFRDELTRV